MILCALTIPLIASVFTCITVGAYDTTLVLRSISHEIADELTNPVRNPLVCLKCIDQFDYNCRTYYYSKKLGDVVTAYGIVNDDEINIRMWTMIILNMCV